MPTNPPRDAEEARTHARTFDPQRLTADFYESPYATYAALRAWDPVHRCADGGYFLTRYADLDQVYRDRVRFSSDKRAVFGPVFGETSPLYAHHTTSLVFNDAPYHTRVRRPIVDALSPSAVRGLEASVTSLVDTLIERLRDLRKFDLIEDFAAHIPVEVIGNLLRVPREDRGPLRGWSLAILGALEATTTAAQLQQGNEAVCEFTHYLRELIDERRRYPGPNTDLLTGLLREKELSEDELLQNCIFLLNAGHETTTNIIGNGLHLLLRTPAAAQLLREDPTLAGSAIEECLRLESPNQLGNRLVSERVTIGGVALEAGTYLTLCIGAANHDPEEFARPDLFDIKRKPNRHLAFAAGAHACVGMGVARLEAQVALLRILQKLPELHLRGEGQRGARARFRGFVSLPAEIA
jgi:cytochrome P450